MTRFSTRLALAICAVLASACGAPENSSPPAAQILATTAHLAKSSPKLKAHFGAVAGGWSADGQQTVSSAWLKAQAAKTKNPFLTRSSAPAFADGAWEIFRGQGDAVGIRLTPERAESRPLQLQDGHALYRGVFPATDAVLTADQTSSELAYLLHDASAPTSFSWHVQFGSAIANATLDNGGLRFVSAQGKALMEMPQPIVVDSAGITRIASLDWDAKQARLTIKLDTHGLEFPVLLDPSVTTFVWTQVTTSTAPPGTLRRIDGYPRRQGRPLWRSWSRHRLQRHLDF